MEVVRVMASLVGWRIFRRNCGLERYVGDESGPPLVVDVKAEERCVMCVKGDVAVERVRGAAEERAESVKVDACVGVGTGSCEGMMR